VRPSKVLTPSSCCTVQCSVLMPYSGVHWMSVAASGGVDEEGGVPDAPICGAVTRTPQEEEWRERSVGG